MQCCRLFFLSKMEQLGLGISHLRWPWWCFLESTYKTVMKQHNAQLEWLYKTYATLFPFVFRFIYLFDFFSRLNERVMPHLLVTSPEKRGDIKSLILAVFSSLGVLLISVESTHLHFSYQNQDHLQGLSWQNQALNYENANENYRKIFLPIGLKKTPNSMVKLLRELSLRSFSAADILTCNRTSFSRDKPHWIVLSRILCILI